MHNIADISDIAFRIKDNNIALLEKHGNELTTTHQKAIEQIALLASRMAHDEEFGRHAIPLETGMGKTTFIIAALKTFQDTDLSAIICCETVEHQKELLGGLIEAGVRTELIGCYHKVISQEKTHPSILLSDAQNYQFLIMCHQKTYVDSKKDSVNWMNTFNRKPRSIGFWDERLNSKACHYLFMDLLRSAIGAWLPMYESKYQENQFGGFDLRNANMLTTLGTWVKDVELYLSQLPNENDIVLELPNIELSLEDCKRGLDYIHYRASGAEEGNNLILELIRYTQLGRIRLSKPNNKFSLIQFESQIHESLTKLMIFDATIKINELQKYDQSVKIVDMPIRKSYENVTINLVPGYSSKYHLTSKNKGRNLSKYYADIDEILKKLPATEELLIITFKDIVDEVTKHFSNQLQYFDRVTVIHWGIHKGSNAYSRFKHIFTLGVMRRNQSDLMANILGYMNDIEAMVLPQALKNAEHSEMAIDLIQAFGRGHNRITKSGKAGKTTIWLYLPNKDRPVVDLIKAALTNVAIVELDLPRNAAKQEKRKPAQETQACLIDHILSDYNGLEITFDNLRRMCNPNLSSQDKTFQRAINYFIKYIDPRWSKDKKRLVRHDIYDVITNTDTDDLYTDDFRRWVANQKEAQGME